MLWGFHLTDFYLTNAPFLRPDFKPLTYGPPAFAGRPHSFAPHSNNYRPQPYQHNPSFSSKPEFAARISAVSALPQYQENPEYRKPSGIFRSTAISHEEVAHVDAAVEKGAPTKQVEALSGPASFRHASVSHNLEAIRSQWAAQQPVSSQQRFRQPFTPSYEPYGRQHESLGHVPQQFYRPHNVRPQGFHPTAQEFQHPQPARHQHFWEQANIRQPAYGRPQSFAPVYMPARPFADSGLFRSLQQPFNPQGAVAEEVSHTPGPHGSKPVELNTKESVRPSVQSIKVQAAEAPKNEIPAEAPAWLKPGPHGDDVVGVVYTDTNELRSEKVGAEGCYPMKLEHLPLLRINPYSGTIATFYSADDCNGSVIVDHVSSYSEASNHKDIPQSVLLCSSSGSHTDPRCQK
ncbi:hypothetical protein HK102_006622 [Quaeritorhiza haematococci]|nr:hypothetical protein HK102_006622 [Quaeritorhiza haematococci]